MRLISLVCAISIIIGWTTLSARAADPPDIRVTTIICNSNATSSFKVDGFSTSVAGFTIPEQTPCPEAIRQIFNRNMKHAYSQHMIAPNRMEYSFTDEGDFITTNDWFAANIICNANTTGTFVVDAVSFSTNVPPAPVLAAAGAECAQAVTNIMGAGIDSNFPGVGVRRTQLLPMLIAPNRVVFTFVGTHVPVPPAPRTSIITCKINNQTETNFMDTLFVDGASASTVPLAVRGVEGDNCAGTMGKMIGSGVGWLFAMEVLADLRAVFVFSDLSDTRPPNEPHARPSIGICSANVTGVYTTSGGAGEVVGATANACPAGLVGVRATGINLLAGSKLIYQFHVLYLSLDQGASLLPISLFY